MHPKYTYASIEFVLNTAFLPESYRRRMRHHPVFVPAPSVQLIQVTPTQTIPLITYSPSVRTKPSAPPPTPVLQPTLLPLDDIPPLTLDRETSPRLAEANDEVGKEESVEESVEESSEGSYKEPDIHDDDSRVCAKVSQDGSK